MSTDPVRDFVASRRAAGTPFCLPAEILADLLGVDVASARTTLGDLASEGQVIRRVWALCRSCAQPLAEAHPPDPDDPNHDHYSKTDPLGLWRAACTPCHNCDESPVGRPRGEGVPSVTTWSAFGHVVPLDLRELHPGPEMDALVAYALGVVPCAAWEPTNLGSAGGPAVMARGCYHAPGACYPTVEHHGAGGLPPYSRPAGRWHHQGLSLRDLPPGTTLSRHPALDDASVDTWQVALPGLQPLVAPTEPHALAVAVLVSSRFTGHLEGMGERERQLFRRTVPFTPRFTEATRWRGSWKKLAVERGVASAEPGTAADLPRPWTPRLVLVLDDLLRATERAAHYDEAVRLEETRPRRQRMLFSESLRDHHGADPDSARAELAACGIDARAREADAADDGVARARQEFDQRTERLAREGR